MQKYPSPSDIAEMKARGYDSQTIEDEEEKGLRWYAAERVREIIRLAFKDVKLGNGIGLKEADGIDEYKDAVTLAEYRAEDEKEDWQRIPIDKLNRYWSGLGYLDAEGMRFHLPAYLIAELNGDYNMGDLSYRLTKLSEHSIPRFDLLSPLQRNAVRDFLVYMAEEATDSEFPNILRALEEYWTEQSIS